MDVSEAIEKQENVNILQSMKELISAAKDYKIVDKLVVNKMTSIKDWILAKATAYGVNETRREEVVSRCSEAMNEIKSKFEEDRKKLLAEEAELVKSEIESSTKVANLKYEIKELESSDEYKIHVKYYDGKRNEAKRLQAEGREDEAKQILEELDKYRNKNSILKIVMDKREELEENKTEYKESVKGYKEKEKARKKLIDETKKKISEIAKNDEKSLAKINRSRFLPRLVKKLIDKVGGEAKFEKFADSLIANVSETANKTRGRAKPSSCF